MTTPTPPDRMMLTCFAGDTKSHIFTISGSDNQCLFCIWKKVSDATRISCYYTEIKRKLDGSIIYFFSFSLLVTLIAVWWGWAFCVCFFRTYLFHVYQLLYFVGINVKLIVLYFFIKTQHISFSNKQVKWHTLAYRVPLDTKQETKGNYWQKLVHSLFFSRLELTLLSPWIELDPRLFDTA